MIDPPRLEAIAAVHRCQQAGIAVKMITGDHAVTARAIARQIGLDGVAAGVPPDAVGGILPPGVWPEVSDPRQVTTQGPPRGTPGSTAGETPATTCLGEPATLSGRELEKLPDEQLPEVAEHTAVFARVAPEQKLRLVRALQSRGHVVAMTGDGVNDAPALKQADIGVAMGISGTDVAKGAAAMVLTDDNFASIEAAVEEGRGVFDNITKFIVWILPTNLGEAAMLITAILLGLPLPALALQLLWVNLTDTLLGLPLAFEPKEQGLMNRPPRNPRQPLLTHPLIMRTGLVTLIILIGGLALFLWELRANNSGLAVARTVVVNLFVVVEALYLFNCRSLNHPFFSVGLFGNRLVLCGAFAMLGAQLLFTYTPLMNKLFHTAPIGAESWLRIAAVAVTAFAAVEFEKWIRFGGRRGEHVIPE